MGNETEELLNELSDYRCEIHLCGSIASCYACKRYAKLKSIVVAALNETNESLAACAAKDQAIITYFEFFSHLKVCQEGECEKCLAMAKNAQSTGHEALKSSCGKAMLVKVNQADDLISKMEELTPKVEKVLARNQGMESTLKTFISMHDEDSQQEEGCNCAVCEAAKNLIANEA